MLRNTRNQTDGGAISHLAAIVENSDDAILSKDLNGIITSWNAAAGRLFGYSAEEIIGKSVTLLAPPEFVAEEPDILGKIRRGEHIRNYETVRMAKDGTRYDVSLSVSPVKDEEGRIVGASTIARDVTERKRAERLLLQQRRRLEQIDRISKLIVGELDLDRVLQTVTDIGTEMTGAQYGAFFYNRPDGTDGGDTPCAPSGGFTAFGSLRNTPLFDPVFQGAGVVRSDDIRVDPRHGGNTPRLPVASYLAVPVAGHDAEILGGLFFGHREPGRFTQESEDNAVAIAAHAAIAIGNAKLHKAAKEEIARRRKAEEAKELMLLEIQHRVKNSLGIVQAIVNQSFKDSPRDQRHAFAARLRALSQAHELLSSEHWDGALAGDVVRHAIAPFHEDASGRFCLSGPEVELSSRHALLLTLILHELATNAVKYGALSNAGGTVHLAWEWSRDRPHMMELIWQEKGGPPVTVPKRKGFGTTLLERALRNGGGKAGVVFAPEGLICKIGLPARPERSDSAA